jgi:nucleotide-binding universal stress UspA family protein
MGVIVVGVDGSAAGEHALWYAAGLASRQGFELVAVYVRRTPPTAFTDLVAGAVVCDPCDEQERRGLEAVRDVCEEAGVRWSFVVRQGGAADELHAVAVERDAALIVVGTRGDGLGARLRRLTHGSVSTRLARREPMPVLVVR